MIETSQHLNLPYIMPAQAQKHITHNEALRILDAVTQLTVQNADQTAPPTSVEDGDRFVVAATATGTWAGQDKQIAYFDQGQWQFIAPQTGWRAFDQAAQADIVFDGNDWISPATEQVPSIGVNATADTTNRLTVSSDAVLFDHAGTSHQMKVNKAAAGDTASLLFQTFYSGRAEMGTVGSDDFAIKVSQDGAVWFTALSVDATTGAVVMPHTPLKEVLSASRTYFVNATSGADTNDGLSAGTAFASVESALAAMCSVDACGHDLIVQLADGTYTISQPIGTEFAANNVGTYIFVGNSTNPENVVLTGTESIFHVSHARIKIQDLKLETTHNSNAALFLDTFSSAVIENLVFGAAATQIELVHSSLACGTEYSIAGDADYHIKMSKCASIDLDFSTITLVGTRDFSTAFIQCQGCTYAEIQAVTFVGTATGRRYQVYHNSAVQTLNSGDSYLPGSVSGVTASGGLYS